MSAMTTDVLVIGGGATGAGVAWDAALRGLEVVLVERGDLATGTSGRFHGLLHSGGRYVVKDPVAARECIAENRTLKRVAAACIEDTGGLFLTTPWDDPAYAERFVRACGETGVDCEEISVAQALREEPRLNPRISRAFRVPDANLEVWELVGALAQGASRRGARILTHHEVTDIRRDGDRVTGAVVRDLHGDRELEIEAAVTVNAAGAWCDRVTALAGIEGVRILPGRGIMIAANHRLVNTVINRCELPGDGDILVPIQTVSVIGTTDQRVANADDLTVPAEEVAQMLDDGEKLVPGFRQARMLRVWSGVRPLFEDTKAGDSGGPAASRDVTRTHTVLDHRQRDGIGGFVTVTGGKLTTYRLMAEQTVDVACAILGRGAACATATTSLPGSEGGAHFHIGERLARKEAVLPHETVVGAPTVGGPAASEPAVGGSAAGGPAAGHESPAAAVDGQTICECELVSRTRLEQAIAATPGADLDDLRRRLRIGMGPCQGGICMYRAAGVMHACDRPLDQVNAALRAFIAERGRGVTPIVAGDQARQMQVDGWIFRGTLGLGGLPAPAIPAMPPTPAPSAMPPAPAASTPPAPHARVRRYDAVVVGAGAMGLTAAVRLAQSGRRTVLIARGPGSLSLSPATIDSPLEAEVRQWLLETVAVGTLPGYTYGEAGTLPTPLGMLKSVQLAPVTMLAGSYYSSPGRAAIVGTPALRDFQAGLCAANLSSAGFAARAVEFDWQLDRIDANALQAAGRFDDPHWRAQFADALAAHLDEDDARVGLPAVLGLRDTSMVQTELERRLGRRVFEIPTLPPSVPGMRLAEILRTALTAAGGRLVLGPEVTGVERDRAGRITAVITESAGSPTTYRADAFVLATGEAMLSTAEAIASGWRAAQEVVA